MLATGKPVPEVAQQYGYSKHTFYRVINGERHNQVVRDLIADLIQAIEAPVILVWPEEQEKEVRE